MTTYRYSAPSIIDEISLHKTENGSLRAYIHAREGTQPLHYAAIIDALQHRNFVCVPSSQHGRPALEIRGFTNSAQFTEILREQQFISGDATITKQPHPPQSFRERLRNHSLFASGLFYIIGDIKFFTYGYKGGSPLDMAAGGFYGAGTWANLAFNHKSNADLQVQDIAKHMADYMNQQRFTVPKDAALQCILDDKHKGKLKKANDFFRRYPAEMMHAFFAMAGVCIALAAHKKINTHDSATMEEMLTRFMAKNHPNDLQNTVLRQNAYKRLGDFHKTANWLDVGLGSLTFASGMFGALVKEKAHDPDQPRKQGIAGLWEKIQEHPLTVSGIGLMVSTLCHAVSTGIEWKIGTKNAQEAIFDRGVFVATNLMAEILIAISSKGHGDGVVGDKTVHDTAIAIAADAIVKEPADKQEELIDCLAGFLSRKDLLSLKNEEVKNQLRAQVELLQGNPWSHCTKESKDTRGQWQKIVHPSAQATTPLIH